MGQVVLLANVLTKIEKLYGVVLIVFEQFVIAQANGAARTLHAMIAVVGKVPIDGAAVEGLPFQCWDETLSICSLVRHCR